MEAATPLNRTHVRVVGEHVLADGLVIADEHLVALAVEASDPERIVQDAVAIGARVLRREGAAVDVEELRRGIESTAAVVKADFTERAGEVARRLDARVDAAFGAEDGTVARLLARHFGDESSDAVQHKVRAVLAEMSVQVRDDLRRQFAADSDDNPLAAYHRTQLAVLKQTAGQHTEALGKVSERMEELRLEVERLRAEKEKLEELAAERDRGTAKGRDFEEALTDALDAIAVAQGDDCEAVGDRADSGSAKTGDMVVTIDGANSTGRGRIVFEAKNARVARPEMLRQLDRALTARNADFAVLVVAGEENLPPNTTQLREIHGDKLVVAWDPGEGSDIALRVAYSLARARVLMRAADAEGIDGSAIRTAVERALQGLEQVRNVKQQLTASKSAIDKATGHVDALAAVVKAQLSEIDALVAAAGDAQLSLDA